MRYRLLFLTETNSIKPILGDNDKPLTLAVSNSIDISVGDRIKIGSNIVEVRNRIFNIEDISNCDLIVKLVGKTLDVQAGILGSTAKIG